VVRGDSNAIERDRSLTAHLAVAHGIFRKFEL
jgi:hypothetical protein